MKYILTLLCFGVLSAYGQEPAYTPMRLNYQFRGIKVDSLFLIPSFNDTTAANSSTMKNVAGAMIRTGNDFYMRNATTNAWLQNVNVGTGASPSIQFVDSVWRVLGKDSIFWRKGGTTNKIKDSTGLAKAVDTIYRTAGKDSIFFKIAGTTYKIKDSTVTDSPDRIDGTANDTVRANMSGNEFYIDNASFIQLSPNIGGAYFQMSSTILGISNGYIAINGFDSLYLFGQNKVNIESDEIKLTSLLVSINADTIKTNGQIKLQAADGTVIKAGDFTDANKIGNVLYNRGSDNANTNGGDFHAYIPGVFKMNDASSSNDFFLPDPTLFPGQMCIVINKDATDATGLAVENSGGLIYDKGTATQITSLPATEMGTFFSDGANWYGFTQ